MSAFPFQTFLDHELKFRLAAEWCSALRCFSGPTPHACHVGARAVGFSSGAAMLT